MNAVRKLLNKRDALHRQAEGMSGHIGNAVCEAVCGEVSKYLRPEFVWSSKIVDAEIARVRFVTVYLTAEIADIPIGRAAALWGRSAGFSSNCNKAMRNDADALALCRKVREKIKAK